MMVVDRVIYTVVNIGTTEQETRSCLTCIQDVLVTSCDLAGNATRTGQMRTIADDTSSSRKADTEFIN